MTATHAGARGADDVVRARINSDLKNEATAVLASIGLTPSDAFRLMLVRVVADRALPFEPWRPNEETIAAMREPRTDGARHKSVSALLADLNAGD